MAQKTHRIGVLTSTSGSYGAVGKTILNGVCLAVEELNRTHEDMRLELVCANPNGENAAYVRAAQSMLNSGIQHVVGCYTSSSRKDILPLFERAGATLWYPAHYEGFESSDNVVYTGTAPNHHISPMVDFMFSLFGKTAHCVGSNYIWAWESTRVFKDEFSRLGGRVLNESYVPIDGTDMDVIIERIFSQKPAFILNTLIGASSYYFFRRFREKCEERGLDQPSRFPVVSCSLSEADLYEIGPQACDGHFSSSVYFASVDTPENQEFVSTYKATYPGESLPTVEAEAAYIAMHLLGAALASCPDGDAATVRKTALNYRLRAPQGEVCLDPLTFHAYLTPRIGRSRSNGEFDIVTQAEKPVRPDPYLVGACTDLVLPSPTGVNTP